MTNQTECEVPLDKWLEAKNLTSAWLARQANVSRASVTQWRQGKTKPTRHLERLKAITGLTEADLLSWDSANPLSGRGFLASAARPAA